MRRNAFAMTCAVLCATGWAAAPAAPAAEGGPEDLAKAAALWKQMCSAEADSADFQAAQWKLTALLGTMPVHKRCAAATAMMDAEAEPFVNAAAVELFGTDGLAIADVQRTLWDAQRTNEQRELLKTYYSFCRPEVKGATLSEGMRLQLVDVLSERLGALAGTRAHYGEQRLLVHLCSSVLSRYGRSDAPQAKGLVQAMQKYAEKAEPADTFAAAIPIWLELARAKDATIDTFSKAVQAMGHWDAVVRLKAAAYLGELILTDDKAAQVVLAMLGDGRDEARAAAAHVFAFAKSYKPQRVVPSLIVALTEDRGVAVQAAAAEALAARAEQANDQVGPLLDVLNSPARRLGAKRTSSILTVLAKLMPYATPDQKSQALRLATMRLETSPDGSLAVLEALGPDAAAAAPTVREFRASANRFQKSYIDRHVLPSILPDEARKP